MTVYITPRLLNYHSFNAFGIAIKALGILLCNCCISFIDLIMLFVQRLINYWHWWLWSSRFLFYCALSRSPPDIPVVISKNDYWSWFVRMPSECCAFIESGYSRASVWLFNKGLKSTVFYFRLILVWLFQSRKFCKLSIHTGLLASRHVFRFRFFLDFVVKLNYLFI